MLGATALKISEEFEVEAYLCQITYTRQKIDPAKTRKDAALKFVPSGVATVWLSGGTAGMVCIILDRVTTSLGRTYDQSVKLRIKNK